MKTFKLINVKELFIFNSYNIKLNCGNIIVNSKRKYYGNKQ